MMSGLSLQTSVPASHNRGGWWLHYGSYLVE